MKDIDHIQKINESVQRSAQSVAAEAAEIMHRHDLPKELEAFVFRAVKQLQGAAEVCSILSDSTSKFLEQNQKLSQFTEAVRQVLWEDGFLKADPGSEPEEIK